MVVTEGQSNWYNMNLTRAENLKLAIAWKPSLSSSLLVGYPRLLQGEWISSWYIPDISWTPWCVVKHRSRIYNIYGVFKLKKGNNSVRIWLRGRGCWLSEVYCYWIFWRGLPAKFSPFLLEKVISPRATPKKLMKIRNCNLLVEVMGRKQAESIFKMKTFHIRKWRAYPRKELNTSKGVIRSRELVTDADIASLRKNWEIHYRRISIRKGKKRIQTNTFIQTFNYSRTVKEVKIGFCLQRVEQYVAAPLGFFKCQKYGCYREACRPRQTCAKCREKNPDHLEEDYLKWIRYTNCRQDHLSYARSSDVFKKR